MALDNDKVSLLKNITMCFRKDLTSGLFQIIKKWEKEDQRSKTFKKTLIQLRTQNKLLKMGPKPKPKETENVNNWFNRDPFMIPFWITLGATLGWRFGNWIF